MKRRIPVEVSLLRADAVVLDAQMPADAIEKFPTRSCGEGRGGSRGNHDAAKITSLRSVFSSLHERKKTSEKTSSLEAVAKVLGADL